MKLRLVSHASVITTTTDTKIWCDPWLTGKAFNGSWSLFPEPSFQDEWLDGIDYLWISHEHPDHLSMPTLRALPRSFKKRVTVLYQDRDAGEVLRTLAGMGYRRSRRLVHRETLKLTSDTRIHCHLARFGDSCLAIMDSSGTILNVNDALIDAGDCAQMSADVGPIEVLLKQFSLAGYVGGKDHARELPEHAATILRDMVTAHRALGARVTISFASFVRFSTTDNAYMNAYANRPQDVYRVLEGNGCACALLVPGDELDTEQAFDSAPRLARCDAVYADFERLPLDEPPIIPLEELTAAFQSFAADLHDKYPRRRLALLPPVRIRIPDLDRMIEMSISERRFSTVTQPALAHLEAGSQALHFAFRERYGFETMTISGRVFELHDDGAWARNRELLWIYRRQIYLAARWLVSPRNLSRVAPWARTQGWTMRGALRWYAGELRRLAREWGMARG